MHNTDTNQNKDNHKKIYRDKFKSILPISQWLDIGTKKTLGQNFLLNLDITDKISYLANIPDNGVVMEIGPGLGPLTMSLLGNYSSMHKLYVIEKDERLQNHLRKIQVIDNRLSIIMGDCLEITIPQEVEHIVANLPYNISVPFIMKCLQFHPHIKTMTLLVQKEVGERFVSSYKKKSYGKISVLAQLFSSVKIVYELGPKAFTPPPKVDSVLLYFQIKNSNLLFLWPVLEEILRLMFQQRRKMLSNTLGKKYPFLLQYLSNKRCEDLVPEEILNLAKIIKEQETSCQKDPL